MSDIAFHDPYTDSIPRCFERIVAAYPENLAVGGTGWQPTFAELNVTANRVAHAILRSGAVAGDRVAILMGHDAPMVAAVMGVLKAGCVATVFNTIDPPARLRQLVENADPVIVLAEASVRAIGAEIAGSVALLCFDDITSDGPSHNPALEISADHNAFIVYTSGSTGRPNGVLHVHGAVIANAQKSASQLEASSTDRVLLLASVGSGQGAVTFFTGLLSGASLWPFLTLEKGVHGLADYIAENAITACVWSASIFRHMAMTISPERRFPSVRSIRLASERSTHQDFRIFQRHFSDRCALHYVLSSSETGGIASLMLRPGDDVGEGALPIGRPFDGVTIELLDETGHPVPRGEPGQLVVTSRSVTVGYWRNPDLTAERCVVPVDGRHRTLRTRDLVRWNEAGLLEFVGRQQGRAKIRGYTIELPEVERAVLTLHGVKAATCRVFEMPQREPRLVAFVVRERTPQPGDALQPATLRRLLQALLPRQMIPSTFVFLDELPLSANGKIDQNKLRELYEVRERNNSDLPATHTETMLAQIWGDILGFEDIGRRDDFFDLGGDSLTASVATAWVQAQAGVQLDLGMFTAYPTLNSMAALVDDLRSSGRAPQIVEQLPPDVASRVAPLSFAQQFYWDTSQTAESAAQHTGVGYFRLVGSLDRSAFQDAMKSLFQRFDMLRTAFGEVNGQVAQIVDSTAVLSLPFLDVSSYPDPVARARALLLDDRSHRFDLRRPPLIVFRLIRLNDHEHWLAHVSHHIAVDGFSWRIFARELADCYDAKVNGAEEAGLVARRFADFARWQRREFQPSSPRYREALIALIDEHLRGAYPRYTAYRNLLVWCLRRSYPKRTIRSALMGFLLRTAFALPSPPAKPLPFRRRSAGAETDLIEGLISWRLSPEVVRRLDKLGRDEGTTHAAARLAACAVALSKAIGSPKVAIATQFTNRSQPETRDVFGFCANLVTCALDCDSDLAFRELVRVVGDRFRRLQTRSGFPHDELQRMLRAWKIKPLRNAVHVSVATAMPPICIKGLQLVKGEEYMWHANIEFKFAAANDDRDDQLWFDARLYEPAALRAFASRLVCLFDVASRYPDLRLSELLAMSEGGSDDAIFGAMQLVIREVAIAR